MITVTVYVLPNRSECQAVLRQLEELRVEIPHDLAVVDVSTDAVLQQAYGDKVPIVLAGPYRLAYPFTKQELMVTLGAARDRLEHQERVQDDQARARRERGHTIRGVDRFSMWITRHYMFVINLVMALFVGLPFLAPVLMQAGSTSAARVIYTVYSPFCHQLAFRSFFLFGEQAVYPRSLAGLSGMITFEKLIGHEHIDLTEARNFVGNDQAGYKLALCERDIAIYGSFLLFALLFVLTGRKIRTVPWYVWLILGVIPMGLDGVSQIPSLLTGMPGWIPMRESTPFFRVLTGSLFGITSAWYLLPILEETMSDTRQLLAGKFAVVRQLGRHQEDGR